MKWISGLKTRCRPENEKPGNEKLNSRFRPKKNCLKPGKGHFLVYFNKSSVWLSAISRTAAIYFPNVQKRDERDKEKKKDILLTFSALSMILTMAVRSSNLPAAVKDIGDAAINTWYKVLSKILNTFSGVAALIFVARLLG